MTDTRNLTFNDATMRVIDRDGEPWITATDLARALGYSRPDKIAQIYRRNADEFSAAMTAMERLDQLSPGQFDRVTQLGKRFPHGAQPQFEVMPRQAHGQIDRVPGSTGHSDTRIFSLRGAHLIAMFAKTPVAASFRRWVLDILDGWSAARAATPLPSSITPEQKVARLVEGHDIVVMQELGDAMGLPVQRDSYMWLAEVMHGLGFYNAWVRTDSAPSAALPRRTLRPSDRG